MNKVFYEDVAEYGRIVFISDNMHVTVTDMCYIRSGEWAGVGIHIHVKVVLS